MTISFKLGKQPYEEDYRTIKLASYLAPDIQVPVSWDFDKNRHSFPLHVWGNDKYGNCVIAAQANQELRVERIETRRTLPLTDEDVIDRYKTLTGCREPNDVNDQGMIMLQALRQWRAGWPIKKHTYKIAAFGEVNSVDHKLLRTCCFLFNGLQLGFALPLNAREQTLNNVWDYIEGPGSERGSWGGHAVYSKRFDSANLYVLSWGYEVRVTNAFVEHYCDEAWALIDDFDPWLKSHGVLNVQSMIEQMKNNGVSVQL